MSIFVMTSACGSGDRTPRIASAPPSTCTPAPAPATFALRTKEEDCPGSDCEAACRGGDGASCFAVGVRLKIVEETETEVSFELADRAKSLAFLDLGCAHGHGPSCRKAGLLAPTFEQDGRGRLERGCRLGFLESCLDLAENVRTSDGACARQLVESVCARGDLRGCLAAMKAAPAGRTRFLFARRACDAGFARSSDGGGWEALEACFEAGLAGLSLPDLIERGEANALLARACTHGNQLDPSIAPWCKTACAHGSSRSCEISCVTFREGTDCDEACKGGHELSCEWRDKALYRIDR